MKLYRPVCVRPGRKPRRQVFSRRGSNLFSKTFDTKGPTSSTIHDSKGGRVGIWPPAHWGLGEIDGLLVPPGKASKLLTDHLITVKRLKSEPAQEKWFSQTIHTY